MIGTTIKIGFDGNAVKAGFRRISAGYSRMVSGFKRIGRTMLAPFVKLMAVMAPILGGGAMIYGIKNILDYGGAVSDLANRAGLSAKKIVILNELFRRTGLEGADVATTLQRMGKNIEAGLELPSSEAGKAMEALNITVEDLAGMDLAEQFEFIGKKIAGMQSESEAARASMAIFGREGAKLINTFRTGGGMDMARKSVGGLAINLGRAADQFDHISDALGSIKVKFQQFFAGVAVQMLPVLEKLADYINQLDLSGMGKSVGQFFQGIADAFQTGTIKTWIDTTVAKFNELMKGTMKFLADYFAYQITKALSKTATGKALGIHDPSRGKAGILDLETGEITEVNQYIRAPQFADYMPKGLDIGPSREQLVQSWRGAHAAGDMETKIRLDGMIRALDDKMEKIERNTRRTADGYQTFAR